MSLLQQQAENCNLFEQTCLQGVGHATHLSRKIGSACTNHWVIVASMVKLMQARSENIQGKLASIAAAFVSSKVTSSRCVFLMTGSILVACLFSLSVPLLLRTCRA